MLNDTESSYLAGALQNLAIEKFHAELEVINSPAYRLKVPVVKDGNGWIAIHGDMPTGVTGCGDTPEEAYADFDRNWAGK